MLRWRSNRHQREPEIYSSVVSGLQELYKKNLLALEKDFKFNQFYSPLLTDGDFSAKPMVLLLGQYSTGKTTFIQHLLERDYPGGRIGPEPTTDQFVAVMYGDDDQIIPGNAAVVDKTKPWAQLAEFGNTFLARFTCAVVSSPLLKGMTLIDTPGVLSGSKQNERGYDFSGVIKWFAERVDLILLMFDAHKLDISDELRRCIHSLKGNDTKIRIVLNKADLVSPQQLMRVYGALMWSLGKVIPTPEVARVYIGSFWDAQLKINEYRKLFEAEASDLYSDIAALPKYTAIRKLNDFIKRSRLAKVHILLLAYMRKQMPFFGKTSKQKELTKNIQSLVFPAVSREYDIPMGDFPSPDLLKEKLAQIELAKLPKLDFKKILAIDDMLSRSIPTLMKLIPQEKSSTESIPTEAQMLNTKPSPFLAIGTQSINPNTPGWAIKKYLLTPPNVELYYSDFLHIGPDSHGLVTGAQVKPDLVQKSGLPSSVLHRIWNLADINKDGSLDLYEYSLARHFIDMKLQGFELPHSTPDVLLFPAHDSNNHTTPLSSSSQAEQYTSSTGNNPLTAGFSRPSPGLLNSSLTFPHQVTCELDPYLKTGSDSISTLCVSRDDKNLTSSTEGGFLSRGEDTVQSKHSKFPQNGSLSFGLGSVDGDFSQVQTNGKNHNEYFSKSFREDDDDLQSSMTEEILFSAQTASVENDSKRNIFSVTD